MILTFCLLIIILASHTCTITALFSKPIIKSKFQSFPFILAFIIIAGSISSCQSANEKAKDIALKDSIALIELPKPLPIAKAEAERLNRACQLWYDSTLLLKGFNGGMLLAKNGSIVFEKYTGTVHLPGTDFITANTPLHIASVSKTFTAMAVLKLWQNGKINIDDELSKYIKTFNYPGVTIRSLLNHRSGLPNYLYFLETIGWDKTKTATNEDIFNILVTKKNILENIAPPNTHFSYCNTNYALLALLIEKVTGKKFSEFLQQTFFTPLQMQNTFVFTGADSLKANPSYDWRGSIIPLNYLDGIYGDKNIYSSTKDLLIWDRALGSNKIFTEETLQNAYTAYSNEKPGIKNYGLGWRMNIYPDGKKMIFHNGWWHGSNATFIRLLQEDATIIVIGNKFTRSIYHAKILCNLFGEYYSAEEEEENYNIKKTDSITLPETKLSKKDSRMQQMFKYKNKVNTQK